MVRLRLLLLFLGFTLGGHAGAEAPGDIIAAFFDDLRSLEARFEQTILGDGRVLQETEGTLHVVRPGQFRWHYEAPFEQLIVTDGEVLWVYEPDLEQATRSRLDRAVGNTPALLLSTEEPLDRLFAITDDAPGRQDGLRWRRLKPLGEQATFSHVLLGFDASGALSAMEIVDSLEQRVFLRFRALRRNTPIDPALFDFTPPAGIDVITGD